MNKHAVKVESCIKEAKHVRKSTEQMAQEEIHNLTLGCSDSEEESDNKEIQLIDLTPETETWLIQLMRSSDFNWFEFVHQIESSTQLEQEPQSLLKSFPLIYQSMGIQRQN